MGNCWGARSTAVNPSLSGAPTSSSAQTSKSKIVSQGSSSAGSSYPTSQNAGDNSLHSPSGSVRAFTYSDLRAATRNFRQENLLGEGGFGCVYKGWIDEQGFMAARPGTGMVIAVKKLNLDGLQGHKEWLAEVHFLGQLSHPNLVKLIGFCAEDDHRLLAYEFMPRGSLENHLLRTASHNQTLPWHIRMKIAMGAAKGLAFLHDAERAVIYRDFKASNILLDSEYNAKLSDFGLAKNGPTGDKTHVTTEVMGTYGYAAPEYVATGHLTAKSDVYSFGVVLLEILTGLRAVDKNRPGGQQNLVDWAKPYLGDKRKLFRLIDSRLDGKYSMKGAHKLTNLALSCLQTESKMRPQMKEVVEELEPLVGMKYQTKPSNNREHPNGASALLAHQQSPNLSPVHARYRQSPTLSPLHAHNRGSPRAGGEKAGRR